MDEGQNSIRNFPTATDVLADILVRLPPNVRRRLRLVCRLWRAVIDQRTATDMRARGKILTVTTEGTAYIFDILSPWRPARALSWPTGYATRRSYNAMSVVGTCNGIVCMCDDREAGGALTLTNPSTGETLYLPQLPMSDVNVLAWRNCSVMPTEPLPVTARGDCWLTDCWLTKVHGRLGAVVGGGDSVTVWVLESERWSRQYDVEARLMWELTCPHFAHGDYVLTHGGSGKFVRGSKMSETTRTQGGAVQIRRNDLVKAMIFLRYRISQTVEPHRL